MARQRHSELAAGIFVIAALGILIGVIIWLGGADIFRPARQKAIFFAEEKAGSIGLLEGGFVLLGDDQVGKISTIRFDPDSGRTFYTAEIDRADIEIHSDGKAQVAAGLIGGSRLVIVDRGTKDAPLAGSDNPIEISGGLAQAMANLSAALENVTKQLDLENSDTILAKLKSAVDDVAEIAASIRAQTDPENDAGVLAKLSSTAADVKVISASLRDETDPANDKALLAKIHRSTDDINKMTADAKPKVSEALGHVRDAAKDIRKYVKTDVADMLAQLRRINTNILKISTDFATISRQVKEVTLLHRDNIDELIDNMTQVSANLKAASKEIRRSPWRLFHKPDDKELNNQNIYDAARAFSSGAEQLDQAISKMTSLAKISPDGVAADDPTLLKAREHLKKSFENFVKVEQALWKEVEP